jgi:hypothetical protein
VQATHILEVMLDEALQLIKEYLGVRQLVRATVNQNKNMLIALGGLFDKLTVEDVSDNPAASISERSTSTETQPSHIKSPRSACIIN